MPNKSSLKGRGDSSKQNTVCRDNHGQDIWDNSSFHVKYRTTGKVHFLFLRVFASIEKNFVLVVRLGTRLSFYEVLRYSWQLVLTMFITKKGSSIRYVHPGLFEGTGESAVSVSAPCFLCRFVTKYKKVSYSDSQNYSFLFIPYS